MKMIFRALVQHAVTTGRHFEDRKNHHSIDETTERDCAGNYKE